MQASNIRPRSSHTSNGILIAEKVFIFIFLESVQLVGLSQFTHLVDGGTDGVSVCHLVVDASPLPPPHTSTRRTHKSHEGKSK